MPTVDTLKAYETLTAAKMPEEQARALVSIVQELQEARLAEVATKTDILALRGELKELETRLLKWFITLLLGQGALVVALIKYLK